MAIVAIVILAPFVWYAICWLYGAISMFFELSSAAYQDLTAEQPDLPPPTEHEINLYYCTGGRQGRLPGKESRFGP